MACQIYPSTGLPLHPFFFCSSSTSSLSQMRLLSLSYIRSLADEDASLSKKEEIIQANSDYFIIIINQIGTISIIMNTKSKFKRQNKIFALLREGEKFLSNKKQIVLVHTVTPLYQHSHFMEGRLCTWCILSYIQEIWTSQNITNLLCSCFLLLQPRKCLVVMTL